MWREKHGWRHNCQGLDSSLEFDSTRVETVPSRPVLILGSPWRCDNCLRLGPVMDGTWHQIVDRYEHKCPELDPQAGYSTCQPYQTFGRSVHPDPAPRWVSPEEAARPEEASQWATRKEPID
jgi:hypothetical protein